MIVRRKTINGLQDSNIFFLSSNCGTEMLLKVQIYVKPIYGTSENQRNKGDYVMKTVFSKE